jgi:uncharacterized membrane protein
MINENLQILHISNSLSSLSLLSLLSFFSKSFFLFLALILLFVVPCQIWYQSMAFNCSYN